MYFDFRHLLHQNRIYDEEALVCSPKEKEWEDCGSPRRRGPRAVEGLGGGEAVYGPQAGWYQVLT